MTDHLDDLASAHLDGVTSPEEAAALAGSADAQARLEAMQQARAALRDLPPADPVRRDAAIAAALAAFDEVDVATPSSPARPPTSLAEVAARRRPTVRPLRLVGAAAAIVLLAALVPVLGRLADSGSDDSDTAARVEGSDASGSGDAATDDGQSPSASESGGTDQTTTTAGPTGAPVALGEVGSLDALAQAVAALDPPADDGGAAATFDDLAALQCLATLSPTRAAGAVSATATLDGVPVVAVVTTGPTGLRSLQVFSVPACELVAEQPIAAG